MDRPIGSNAFLLDVNPVLLFNIFFLATILFGLVRLALQTAKRRATSEGQDLPFVPYVFPVLGSSLSFARDPLEFIKRWSSELDTSIFGAHLKGRTIIFVTDPFAVAQIMRSPHLSWEHTKRMIMQNGAMMAQEDIHAVSNVRVILHKALDKHLVHGLDGLVSKYQSALTENYLPSLKTCQAGSGHCVEPNWEAHNILQIFGGAVWSTTMISLYEYPQLANAECYDLALKFDNVFTRFSLTPSKTWQKLTCPEEFDARETLVQKLKSAYNVHCSSFVSDLFSCHEKMKSPENSFRAQLVGVMASTTLNTVPTLFWVVFQILSDEAAHSAVQREVTAICNEIRSRDYNSDENAAAKECVSFSLGDLRRMVNLDSIITETLRLRTTARAFRTRHAFSDCRLKIQVDGKPRTIDMKEGTRMLFCPSLLHQDEEVFGDNARTFQWDRFLPDEDGNPPTFEKNGRKLQRPVDAFGGGISICPGRHIARAQLKLIVAHMMLRYDMRFKGGKVPPLPKIRGDLTSRGMPEEDVEIELRPRVLC